MIRLALALALIATPASAMLCGPSGKLAEILTENHHETVVGQGIGLDGASAVQVWASPGGKSFTIVLVRPQGLSCILADGAEWDHREMPKAGAVH